MTAALIAALTLLSLAAPSSAAQRPAPPPAPAAEPQAGAANTGAKVPPIQDNGAFYELYFEETTEGEAGLTLEQFVKLCQDATNINFTYTEATAGQLKTAKLKRFGRKTIPKSDFYSFFQIMMIINEFVCTKIGPDHLAVVLIQSSAQTNRGGAGTHSRRTRCTSRPKTWTAMRTSRPC